MSVEYINIPVRKMAKTNAVEYITAFKCDLPFSVLNTGAITYGANQIENNTLSFDEPTQATEFLSDMYVYAQTHSGVKIPPSFSDGQVSFNYYSEDGDGLMRFYCTDSKSSVVGYDDFITFFVNFWNRELANSVATSFYFGVIRAEFGLSNSRVYLGITSDNRPFIIMYGRQGIVSVLTDNAFTGYSYDNSKIRYSTRLSSRGTYDAIAIDKIFNGIKISSRYEPSDINTGTYNPNNKSDVVDFPLLPTNINIDAFVHCYTMTNAQLVDFKNELFSSSVADILERWFTKPLNSVVSLNVSPVVPSTQISTIKVGTHSLSAVGGLVENPFVEVDCGTVDIAEYYGNFIDYENTIIQLYCPFVGFIPLKTVDVMSATLSMKYIVNIITGDFNLFVKVVRNKFEINLNSILYETCGNMFAQIPITSSDYSNIITGVMNTITSTASTVASIASGNVSGTIASGTNMVQSATQMLSAPAIQRSGNFNKNASICAMRKPFILIERPRLSIPSSLQSDKGYECNVTFKLRELSGYTEVRHVNLDGIDLTANEKARLDSILKSGFYI